MKFRTFLAVTLMTVAAPAVGGEVEVGQTGKMFSADSITVQSGDRIIFKNDDNVAHNVHSTSAGHRFNLGLQRPGESTTLEIEKSGSFEVRCAIHPRMKMNITAK